MVKFGIIKSKIDKILLESYTNKTFKNEIQTFKSLVLNNKNISKLFYLYDDLNSNKGLNESIVDDYIFESIKIYENTINKIKPEEFNKLNSWVKSVRCENTYTDIDNLFGTGVLTIENRIISKKNISESLKKQPSKVSEPLNLPLSSMVNIANQTISTFIEGLNESDKNELSKLLLSSDETLSKEFISLKENVISKLTNMKTSELDPTVQSKINETLNKVTSEKYDKLSYFKLKSLNESL